MRSRHCATIRRVGAAIALGGIGLAILFRSRSATAATRPYAMPSDLRERMDEGSKPQAEPGGSGCAFGHSKRNHDGMREGHPLFLAERGARCNRRRLAGATLPSRQ